jgi:cytochrome c peroxidase
MTTTRLGFARPLGVLLLAGLVACGAEAPDVATTKEPIAMGFTCYAPGTGFGDVAVPPAPGLLPFVPLFSLKTVPNPILPKDTTGTPRLRADLGAYIANTQAAIQLGKALFWEIQAGSDNKTACATCHFEAGADLRAKNQLNPGANGVFDGYSVNYSITAADFPFVNGLPGSLLKNIDNVMGSSGVRASTFKSLTGGVESVTAGTDPVFGTGRQVTGVNAPTVVNAVFNHRNFFNGRAQPEFNGVNPWGNRDLAARVFAVLDAAGTVGTWDVRIQNASLASQAVGPALNPVEMSAAGRTFPVLGAKLMALKPLGLQTVSPTDSVLGPLAVAGGKGLNTTYTNMIQAAFQPKWWNSTKTVKVAKAGSYPLIQANFSLFWGLSIMLYEATLVSDNTPMDQYTATRVWDAAGNLISSNPAVLDQVVNRLAAQGITVPLVGGGTRAVTVNDILTGLSLFELPTPIPGSPVFGIPAGTGAGCAFCHVGAETTSASLRRMTQGVEPGDAVFKAGGFDLRMERMFMGVRSNPEAIGPPPPPVPFGTDAILYDNGSYAVTVTDVNTTPTNQPVTVNTYDVGWYNIGTRPSAENLGVGGTDFAGLPLSWVNYFQATLANPGVIKVTGGGLGCVDVNGMPIVPPSAPLLNLDGTVNLFAGQVMDPYTGFPILSGPLSKTEGTDSAGSFKTASLRNLELSGPYFHTGGKSTLRQVVEFYDDGGNFANASRSPLIRPLGLTEDQVIGLVAFLTSLTDDRVMYERAPFDHPELPVPVGQDATGADIIVTDPAVGAAGAATPQPRFLGLNPFAP